MRYFKNWEYNRSAQFSRAGVRPGKASLAKGLGNGKQDCVLEFKAKEACYN
jgi:hypothetical protein